MCVFSVNHKFKCKQKCSFQENYKK